MVEAAKRGQLLILDGVHRLPSGLLPAAIGRLLTDRECELPDGTRIVSPASWQRKLRACDGDESRLTSAGLFRCHPAFLAVGIAELTAQSGGGGSSSQQKKSWVGDDVLPLFHFHAVTPLNDAEHLELLVRCTRDTTAGSKGKGEVNEGWLKALLQCAAALRESIAADPTLAPLRLSTRRLLRTARHLGAFAAGGDAKDAVRAALARELSATLALLPPPTQQAVDERVRRELKSAGLSDGTLLPPRDNDDDDGSGGSTTGKRHEEHVKRAKAEHIKKLEEAAVQLRTASMYGMGSTPQAVQGSKQLDAEVNNMRRMEVKEEERKEKVRRDTAIQQDKSVVGGSGNVHGNGGERIRVYGGYVSIDGVIAPARKPSVASLVPSVTFYAVSRHVDLLREMLRLVARPPFIINR